MSDELNTPPVSGSIDAYGVASAPPIVARGSNIVLAAPPSPAYATSVLAAAVGRADATPERPVLLIAPDLALEAWAQVAGRAAAAVSKLAAVGAFPSRAAHHLAGGRVHLLVGTIATAAELLRRSALKPDTCSSLILAWPELELSEESFVPLFADLPKETQRIVITADPKGTASLAERYAWRAPVVGPLGSDPPEAATARLRSAATRWDDRLAATAAVADLLDADELAVWTVDRSSHAGLVERLASHGVIARPIVGEIPGPGPTVFFDAPPPELLGQVTPERAVVLMPPGTESYFGRIASRLEPVRLASSLDQAERAILEDRRAIRTRLESTPDRGAYATVAPLFDRWSAAEVAVAVQSLWTEARSRPAAPAQPGREPVAAARPKLWINIGRKDGATHGEMLAFLSLDLGLGQTLGRLEMKETFTLIEVTAEADAQRAVDKLAGQSFKGRRVAARIDRGREIRGRPR